MKRKKNLGAIISNGRKLRKRLNYGNVEQQFELSDNGFFKGEGCSWASLAAAHQGQFLRGKILGAILGQI